MSLNVITVIMKMGTNHFIPIISALLYNSGNLGDEFVKARTYPV